MKYRNVIFSIVLSLLTAFVFAQNHAVISGVVSNFENGEPLPFASITLKNHKVGTTSSESGTFDFNIPPSMRNDTISISYIGFNSYEVAVQDISGKLNVQLKPAENVLAEVILSDMGPLDYIKEALKALKDNYPQEPYQSISYYREKFIENGRFVNKSEAVFKTWYPKAGDTTRKKHQLLLYRPTENPQKFMFMRDKFEKRQEKEKKKAKKKGDDFEEMIPEEEINKLFGGPGSILGMDINQTGAEIMNFLYPKYFKKYEYYFGNETILNNEVLDTINYRAKKKIDFIKDRGKILISKSTYAIVLIENSGRATIPAVVKPVLFVMGLKIGNPTFQSVIHYQKFNGLWYPKLFRWDANIRLEKRHMFSKNEVSKLQIGQLISINSLSSDPVPIPKIKQFDPEKKMEEQIYNDLNLNWNQINVVRD